MKPKINSILLLALTSTLLFSVNSFAGDKCMITTDRTPCPGKEEAALKPYGKVNPKTEEAKVASKEACIAAVAEQAKIIRKGTLSKKVVNATFGSEKLAEQSSTAECK